jgi:hypothetical protein
MNKFEHLEADYSGGSDTAFREMNVVSPSRPSLEFRVMASRPVLSCYG